MKERPKIDLGMTGYDELFMNDQERAENRLPKIYDIPLAEIDDFPDHPFQVRLDEDMDQLVESVKERGIITPITLRKKNDGRYEIVSGHRRRKACELAGLETIPAEIKELTRDEAIILMVESNLQRSVILPSEKALSYKMRYEALRRVSGARTDLTGDPLEPRLKTSEMVAQEIGDSASQVKRYIRLTYLLPEILQMVDDGKIALRPAVELFNATALHELSHSTGHPTRLNRPQGAFFGTEQYAYEELVAEMCSCFMGTELQTEATPQHIDNHKAYVQSWIQAIREKPETLVKAIKDAQAAANFMDYKAGLITEKEYEKACGSVMEVRVRQRDMER